VSGSFAFSVGLLSTPTHKSTTEAGGSHGRALAERPAPARETVGSATTACSRQVRHPKLNAGKPRQSYAVWLGTTEIRGSVCARTVGVCCNEPRRSVVGEFNLAQPIRAHDDVRGFREAC
jgi:hypothetical protein